MSMTVVKECEMVSGAAENGGKRMRQGQRMPPSVDHPLKPREGAVAAHAQREPYQTYESCLPMFSRLLS